MKVAKRLKGIGEYYFSRKLRELAELGRSRDIINLGIGSPDLPPHPEVIRVLNEESMKPVNHSYQSYRGSAILRSAIAGWYQFVYGVKLDADSETLPLMGSKEGIMHACMTWLNKGDRALVPDPGYPTYSNAVRLAGGECLSYYLKAENDYEPDFERLEKKGLKKVKLMFANYPHMPTGKLPDIELFKKFVEFGRKHGILIIHDNPYSMLLPEGVQPLSMLAVEGAKDTVIELNSLSKSHNMAGWRVGMLSGASERIDEVLRFRSNMDSGMFLPLQLAAARALKLGDGWYTELNRIYAARRMKAYELLDLLGCSYSKEQAGLFAWGRVLEKWKDGYALSDEMLYSADVFLTPGGIFGNEGKKFIRVSVCTNESESAWWVRA